MKNKEMISKLKNNAELAWASYGYYDLIGRKLNDKKNKTKENRVITLHDIMDSTYYDYETQDSSFFNTLKLKGDFTPTQTKNFFDKYELLDFYPKFNERDNKQQNGFHAALFQDKQTKEFTLAIRGSFDLDDYITDFISLLKDSKIPFDYLYTMILFYESCAKKYPEITKPKSLNVVGHSLGGTLAQLFALSFSTDKDSSIINEIYTFNAPGAKDLKPDVILNTKDIYEVIKAFENFIVNEWVA